MIRDLKGEVKNHQIDIDRIKEEDRKYFTFVRFQKSDKAGKLNKEHCGDEKEDNHETCCNFDNIKYEKEYNKTKNKFKEYAKTYYDRKPIDKVLKKNLDEDEKTKKILFKNSFFYYKITQKNNGNFINTEKLKKARGNIIYTMKLFIKQ